MNINPESDSSSNNSLQVLDIQVEAEVPEAGQVHPGRSMLEGDDPPGR
jgi:hypothetical protein